MFDNASHVRLKKSLGTITIVLSSIIMLSACSIPVPLGDLLPELGSSNSGSFTIPNITTSGFDLAPYIGDFKSQDLTTVTTGQNSITLDNIDLDGANPVIDLTGRDELQSKLVSVGISYKVLLSKIGSYDTNGALLQAYLAPANTSSITDSANTLGAPIAVNFINDSQTIDTTFNLKAEQVQALNNRKLRLGFSLKGTINALNSETVGLSYDVQSLKITNLKVAVNEHFPNADNGEVLSIANIDTGVAKVNSLTLNYAATLKQSSPAILKGTATVELYLASSSETNLYQASNLAKSVEVDITGDTLTGQLRVENPLVATVLADNNIRYGLKITGNAIGIEATANSGNEVTFEYEITQLTGTAGVGL